jgi:hypothetical protein
MHQLQNYSPLKPSLTLFNIGPSDPDTNFAQDITYTIIAQ